MNEKIVIGKKLKRTDVIANFIGFSFIPLLLLISSISFFETIGISQNVRIIILSVLSFSWLIAVSIIGSTKRIEVSSKEVFYYYEKGTINQLKEVIRILLGKQEKYNLKLPLDKIESVTISYKITLGMYGMKGYLIVLGFVMKDHTIVKLSPFNIEGSIKVGYLKTLDLLEKNGIQVNDVAGLRNLLSLTDSEIMDYLEGLESDKYD